MIRTRLTLAATLAASFLALAACGGSDALSTDTGGGNSSSGTVIVGSANFNESKLLGEIYAQALEAKGVKVERKLGIGTREVYLKALADGSVNLLPEYNGYLLQYYDKSATAGSPDEVLTELKAKLPGTLTVLNQSEAEDTDGLVVTKATADKYKLTTIADLKPVAGELTLGGPAEWKTRATGVPGLKAKYGLDFDKFITLDAGGPVTVKALQNGRVDAANLFTTDPNIVTKGFVLLEDPDHLFLNANVLPVMAKSAVTPTISDALNAASAKLTTENLTQMLTKLNEEGNNITPVAKDFLTSNGLV